MSQAIVKTAMRFARNHQEVMTNDLTGGERIPLL